MNCLPPLELLSYLQGFLGKIFSCFGVRGALENCRSTLKIKIVHSIFSKFFSYIVLKLKKDDKSVRDVINTLLRQLDLSWMDADLSLTTEILKIVCIFVSNLDIEYQQNELKNTEKKEEKGKITKLIKGMI